MKKYKKFETKALNIATGLMAVMATSTAFADNAARADAQGIDVIFGDTVTVTGDSARELFAALPFEAQVSPVLFCTGGGQTYGGGEECVDTGAIRNTKRAPGLGYCEIIENETSTHPAGKITPPRCQFVGAPTVEQWVNGQEYARPGLDAVGIALGGRTLRTRDGAFSLRCEELVANRYYDCFGRVALKSPSVTARFSAHQAIARDYLSFSNGQLVGGQFSYHASFYGQADAQVQRLLEALTIVNTDAGSARPSSAMYGIAYGQAHWSSVEIQNVRGTVRSATARQIIIDLAPDYVAALRASVRPDQATVFETGNTIFGSFYDGRKIEFSPDLRSATLTIALPN